MFLPHAAAKLVSRKSDGVNMEYQIKTNAVAVSERHVMLLRWNDKKLVMIRDRLYEIRFELESKLVRLSERPIGKTTGLEDADAECHDVLLGYLHDDLSSQGG